METTSSIGIMTFYMRSLMPPKCRGSDPIENYNKRLIDSAKK